jgi:hypothetical protein
MSKKVIGICGFNDIEASELRNSLQGVDFHKLTPILGEQELHNQIEKTDYVVLAHTRGFKDKSRTEDGVLITEIAISTVVGKYTHARL